MPVLHVDELKKLAHGGDEEVEEGLSALLKSYGIPGEYAGEVKRRLKEHIKEEARRRGPPEEEWLIDALYRILIHMAYATL
jgi:hypothetical protein